MNNEVWEGMETLLVVGTHGRLFLEVSECRSCASYAHYKHWDNFGYLQPRVVGNPIMGRSASWGPEYHPWEMLKKLRLIRHILVKFNACKIRQD